jgi:hypothetical protein
MTPRELRTRQTRRVVVGRPEGAPFIGGQGQIVDNIISGTGIGACLCSIRLINGAISRPHIHNNTIASLWCAECGKKGVYTLWGWEFENVALMHEGEGMAIPPVPHLAVMPLDEVPDEIGPPLHHSITQVIEWRNTDKTTDDIEQLDELWSIALERIRELEIPIAEVQKFVPKELTHCLDGLSRGLWYPRSSLP